MEFRRRKLEYPEKTTDLLEVTDKLPYDHDRPSEDFNIWLVKWTS
jgi:hypothetical protein